MKKNLFVAGMLFLLVFQSCGNSDELNEHNGIETEQLTDHSNLIKRVSENNDIEAFANDEILTNFRESYYNFLVAIRDKDIKNVEIFSKEGEMLLNQLYEKYGQQNVLNYIEEMTAKEENKNTDSRVLAVFGTHDGSSCTRNLDGTSYWGNCSFWEGVSAYLGILVNCGPFNPKNHTVQEYENYANCNQAQICKSC